MLIFSFCIYVVIATIQKEFLIMKNKKIIIGLSVFLAVIIAVFAGIF